MSVAPSVAGFFVLIGFAATVILVILVSALLLARGFTTHMGLLEPLPRTIAVLAYHGGLLVGPVLMPIFLIRSLRSVGAWLSSGSAPWSEPDPQDAVGRLGSGALAWGVLALGGCAILNPPGDWSLETRDHPFWFALVPIFTLYPIAMTVAPGAE